MRRNTALPIATGFLSILTLGIAATVLESTPAVSAYDVPTGGAGGSGLSLVEVLLLLVNAVLGLLGIEIDPGAFSPGGGPGIGVLLLVGAVLRSVALPLLAIAIVGTGLLLVGRRLPTATLDSVSTALANWTRPTTQTARARSNSVDAPWPPSEPETDVSDAWVRMTTRLEVERPRSRTPEEWSETAIEAGFDADAVTSLTERFRETRYGGVAETGECQRAAKRELERLEDRGEDETE